MTCGTSRDFGSGEQVNAKADKQTWSLLSALPAWSSNTRMRFDLSVGPPSLSTVFGWTCCSAVAVTRMGAGHCASCVAGRANWRAWRRR